MSVRPSVCPSSEHLLSVYCVPGSVRCWRYSGSYEFLLTRRFRLNPGSWIVNTGKATRGKCPEKRQSRPGGGGCPGSLRT